MPSPNLIHGGLIILDGPDGAGKTTLANALLERLEKRNIKGEYKHLSKPPKGECWNDHRHALLNYIQLMNQGVVVVADRHFLSESIYGAVYREGSEYPLAARHIDRLLYRYGALRVVCAPPVQYIEDIHKKLQSERAEMYTDKMGHVASRYIALWNGDRNLNVLNRDGNYVDSLTFDGGVSDKFGWYHYDVTTDGKQLAAYADTLIDELMEVTSLLPDLKNQRSPNLTGWPRRNAVLLVGDCISEDSNCKVPFMANHGSSLYLAKTLQRLHVDESRLCIVNINDPDGPAQVRSVFPWCSRVIALGKRAEQTLEREKITYHDRVRHPQHARRFSYHDGTYTAELGRAFKGLAGVRE